jgi:fibronectin-binding autotransporter adhesin
LDYFVPSDNVLFGNIGLTNQINVANTVTPSAITVNTTTNYTLAGNGVISGQGGITVSNGSLTILTTNTFTGPVTLDAGVLATPVLANSGSASGIGASSSLPGNFVFNGGTFAYTGPSASTDHGMTLTNAGGAINVTNGTALTLNGGIIGNGPLTVEGSGTLILNNPNSYTNTTTVAATTLQLNNASGAGTGIINFSNGTVAYYPSAGITVANPFNFTAGTTNTVVITSGSSANPISTGNWTGGGVAQISIGYNPYTLNGNLDGMTGTISLEPTTNEFALRFNSTGGNTCFGSTNATFDLGIGNAQLIDRNGGIMNLGALKGGFLTQILGQDADSGTTAWTVGWNNLSTTFSGIIANSSAANDLAALTKVGTGTLTFNCGGILSTSIVVDPNTGFNDTVIGYGTQKMTYTGPTIISNGVLALISPATVSNSPSITLAASTAVLDATAMGYVSNIMDNPLPDGETNELATNSTFEYIFTLNGIGTVRGNLLGDPGSTFNVGLPTGVFNVTSNATLSGAVNMSLDSTNSSTSSELAAQTFTINSSATLSVANTGPGLINGTTFTLFNHGVSGFSTVSLPLTDPTGTTNYTWANNLASNGTITLTTGGVVVQATPPHITFGASGNTLSLSWPSSYLGYNLQVQTNSLAVGVSTNWVTVPGSSSVTSTNITINPANPTVFYRLVQ